MQVLITPGQLTPKCCLPDIGCPFFFLGLLPLEEQLGPKHLILIKKIGYFTCQLIQSELMVVPGQVSLEVVESLQIYTA